MKKVITYGTFDMLHYGHLNLLKRAKLYGDYLIVALSTDNFNKLKDKKSFHNFQERKENLEMLKIVDLVIEENNWEQKVEDIKKYNVDVFVMGDDWNGKFDELKDYCSVIYLERTPSISTTALKEML